MKFACNAHLRVAYETSEEVIRNVPRSPNRAIATADVLEFVRKRYCPKIEMYSRSFAGLTVPAGSVGASGAMMRIEADGAPKSACIVVNSDMPATYQRFCLFQQIGHLATLPPDIPVDPQSYHVCTHINYDLTSISEKELDNDYYLMREQVSNVFALRVLMPGEQFYWKLRELDSVQEAARFFGLTTDAVISRMMIGV